MFVSTDGQGSHTYSYVSSEEFVPNSNVAVLMPKKEMTLQEKIYYSLCITKNRYRFSYGRKPKGERLSKTQLPSPDKIPIWVNEFDTTHIQQSSLPVVNKKLPQLQTEQWAWFELQELFDLKKGKRLTKANIKPGVTAFIGAIDSNNGLRERIQQEPIHDANTITVNYNGNGVAEAFFQPEPYWCSDDVNVLYPKFKLTPYVALFICTIIPKEKYRFNYGRKWHLERMNSSKIKLPVKTDGNPDFEYMEEYIKRVPFSINISS